MFEGVRLKLTEFTWFVSLFIFNEYYLFQCLKVIFFVYLQAAGKQEGKHGY